MNKNPKTELAKRMPFSRQQLIIFVIFFALIGGYAIYRSFAAPNPSLAGDLNNDNTVNITDLSILLSDYNTTNSAADINHDGTVNILDLSILLSHYGQSISIQKPAIPSGLTATTGDGTVALTWSANPSSDQVDVYQVYVNDQNYNLNVASTSIIVSGLTNGTAYTFRVSAHNSAGYGDWTTNAISATPQGAGGGSSSGNGIGLTAQGDTLPNMANPARYSMVQVSLDDAPAACALPSPTRSLVYESGVDVPQSYSDGVDWATANANGWLLKDSGGNLLTNQGYPGVYIGDVGSSGYQQTFITNVSNLLASHHCTGVFIDDVLRALSPLTGSYPSKYPNQTSWQAAMANFISVVGPALKSKGYYVSINAAGYTPGDGDSNDGTLDVQWWQQLGPYVNGIMNENYQQTSEGSLTKRISGTDSWMKEWDGWQRLIGTAQAMGDDFIGLSYGNNDTQMMRYGKGSFLLEWNGGGSVFMYSNGSSDPWNINWTYNIGTPTAVKTQPQSGVWERTYTNGIVIVNPTGSTVTVSGHTIPSADAYIGP